MVTLLKSALILAVACAAICVQAEFEPSVAFVCDRGAMHMHTDDEWVSDPATDCMEGKDEILAYCKKSYPTLAITNIVESSDYKHIKGWCGLGKNCTTEEAFKVRPYRCLTGPFQSDALIVPKDCKFDHVHQADQCHSFDWWSDVAHKACRGLEHMKTESFAMLLPCGTDVFTGVEYVCCPDGSAGHVNISEVTEPKLEVPSIQVKIIPVAETTTKAAENTTEVVDAEEVAAVDKYMHLKDSAYKSDEHSAFSVAKKKLIKVNHDKVTKLMKDWAEARKHVMDMKEIDPKGAELLNKEITPRFQKEYFALQAESDSKILQLDAVHQQHVQTNLDGKKRKTIEKLMDELQRKSPDTATVTKYLKRYISVEEKDAHHCIQHYMKIRDRNAVHGQQMLPHTIEHLTLISTRINQSIGLLDTLDNKATQKKVEEAVSAWKSKTFNSVDTYIATFSKLLTDAKTSSVKKAEATLPPYVKPEEDKEAIKPVITVTDIKPSKTADPNMYKKFAEEFAKTDLVKKPAVVKPFVDEEDEPEDEHVKIPNIQVNHMAKSKGLDVESNGVDMWSAAKGAASSLSVGAAFAIAIGIIAGIAVIAFSIMLAKKKRAGPKKPASNNYVEVAIDDNMSAEDRHIASMQNGYENPTYKFLEKRTV